MNARLGRVDRSGDILRNLERIAGYLKEYRVDVLIVAGDLFSERSSREELRTAVGDIRRIFSPFLRDGGTMLAIAGNHDSEVFFETLRDALELAAPTPGAGEVAPSGRLYLVANPRRPLRLADLAGTVVQFVLMPYPTARCYLRDGSTTYASLAEKHQRIGAAFAETLRELRAQIDPRLPSVLVSHIHVRGVAPRTLYGISEAEDVIFDPSAIPTEWAYVAYGHIHAPGPAIQGAEHVWYAGSVERLNLGEARDEKSVVLCEIGPHGRVGAPQTLPLDATPIYDIEIVDPAEIEGLARRYPDAARALVRYTVCLQAGGPDRETLRLAIERIFPRWYAREFQEQAFGGASDGGGVALRDVTGTVRGYLEERLGADPRRADLLELAERLLAEVL
jgi:hypothetical protein